MAVGALAAAVLLVRAVRRAWVESSGPEIALLAVPAVAFGAADALDGSGFLAAFVAGVTLRLVGRDRLPEARFVDELGKVLAGATFLVFGAIALGPAIGMASWRVVLYALLC